MRFKLKIAKSSIGLIIILVIVLSLIVFLYFNTGSNAIEDAVSSGAMIPVAFIVASPDGELIFTEVILYHPVTNRVALLDIPANSGVVIQAQDRMDRIGLLYNQKDPAPYLKELGRMVGIQVSDYIQIRVGDLERVVDLVGGVELFNPNPSEDPEQDVLLPSGNLLLDGAKAVQFLSYREPGGKPADLIDRRQMFFESLLRTWERNREYLLHEEVFAILYMLVDTSFQRGVLRSYIEEISLLDADRIAFQQVWGVEREVDGQLLLFGHKDGAFLRDAVRQTIKSLADADLLTVDDFGTVIEILNGTDNVGLAGRTGQLYRSFGYGVVEIGNADTSDVEYTEVINWSGDVGVAQRVASVIKCTRISNTLEDMETTENPIDGGVDITIVLGRDFDGRYCK